MTRDEGLGVPIVDLGLELDGPVVSDLDLSVTRGDGGCGGCLVLGRQLRVQDAHNALATLRRRSARSERTNSTCRNETEDQTPHVAHFSLSARLANLPEQAAPDAVQGCFGRKGTTWLVTNPAPDAARARRSSARPRKDPPGRPSSVARVRSLAGS